MKEQGNEDIQKNDLLSDIAAITLLKDIEWNALSSMRGRPSYDRGLKPMQYTLLLNVCLH